MVSRNVVHKQLCITLTRSKNKGGGVAISALKNLQPAFVSDGGENAEAVTIDIYVKNMAISVTSAYGPQESDSVEKKTQFCKYLHDEAHKAKIYGKGYILQGDLNAWLGPNILPGDLHKQNRNGALFESFLNENKLTCVNSLPITEGLITRKRKYLNDVKESTLDFYVVCQRVLPFVTSMKIDNGKSHMLTNYKNVVKGGVAVNSDHYPLTMNLKLEVAPHKKNKVEIFNFSDTSAQAAFKELTSNTTAFTDCFKNVCSVEKSCRYVVKNFKFTL